MHNSYNFVLQIFLLACLVCAAILIDYWDGIYSNSYFDYALAASVIGFVTELLILILYLSGINKKWSTNAACGILVSSYHTETKVCDLMMYNKHSYALGLKK